MGKIKNKEAWNLLKRFPIGTKVIVSARMNDMGEMGEFKDVEVGPLETPRRVPRGGTHRWEAVPCEPAEAWVTGCKWLCDGKVETESYGGGGFEDYEPPYDVTFLAVTKKTPVLLVRRAMFGREIAVPVDGVVEAPWGDRMKDCFMTRKAPIAAPRYRLPDDHPYRKEMREEMTRWPRDARGRWT